MQVTDYKVDTGISFTLKSEKISTVSIEFCTANKQYTIQGVALMMVEISPRLTNFPDSICAHIPKFISIRKYIYL